MTKSDLINEMAAVLNSKKEAQAALESLLSAITGALKNGGRNPQTGKEIVIKPKTVTKFVPAKLLKDAVQ